MKETYDQIYLTPLQNELFGSSFQELIETLRKNTTEIAKSMVLSLRGTTERTYGHKLILENINPNDAFKGLNDNIKLINDEVDRYRIQIGSSTSLTSALNKFTDKFKNETMKRFRQIWKQIDDTLDKVDNLCDQLTNAYHQLLKETDEILKANKIDVPLNSNKLNGKSAVEINPSDAMAMFFEVRDQLAMQCKF